MTDLKLKLATVILLIIHGENFHVFHGLVRNHEIFLVNFCMWILWKLVKAGNHELFWGMKVKMWNSESFSPWMISNIQYLVSLLTTQYHWAEAIILCLPIFLSSLTLLFVLFFFLHFVLNLCFRQKSSMHFCLTHICSNH